MIISNLDSLIGITGVATCGKDTFYRLFSRRVYELCNCKTQRFALADELKEEVRDFLIKDYGVDILNCSPEQKESVRPYLVFYGNFKRFQSNGSLWWEKVKKKMESQPFDPSLLTLITDIRYSQYQKDDLYFIMSNSGYLIHISRLDKNNNIVPPANINEKTYDPIMRKNANICIKWPTTSDESILLEYVDKVIDDYIIFRGYNNISTYIKRKIRNVNV